MDEKQKLKSALDQIHAEDSLKTHTKKYLFEKVYYKEKKRHSPLRKFAAAGVCSLLVFLIGGSYLFFTPTAFISVDVNPSLELGINRFDRVVSVTGYNEDGRTLADSLQVKYMDYSAALESLLSNQELKAYLTEDTEVVLTVAGDSDTQSSEILENVETFSSQHHNVSCHSSDTEEIHHAHEAGLSFGKYQAWEILHELNPDITLEEVQGMTMTEIRDLILKYSQDNFQEYNGSDTPEAIEEPEDSPNDTSQGAEADNSVSGYHHQHGHGHTGD